MMLSKFQKVLQTFPSRQSYLKHQLRYVSWNLSKDNIVSASGSLSFPEENLYSFATKKFAKFGDKPALVDGLTGRQYTFTDVVKRSNDFGKFLHSKGYGVNDVIGIHAENSIEYPIAFYGSVRCGTTFTTASPVYIYDELVRQFELSNPKLLLTTSSQTDVARRVAETCGIELVISMDEPNVQDSGLLYFHDCLDEGNKASNIPELNIDPKNRIAFLPYSSGTTGLPKGVQLSDSSLTTNVIQFSDALDENKEHYERMLAMLPMYHLYCIHVMCMVYLSRGVTLYVLPKFIPETFLDVVQKYKVQSLPIVPPILLFMLNHPIVEEYDLSSVTYVLLGAAPTEENVTNAFTKRFPNATLLQGYGLTECLVSHRQYSDDVLDFKATPGSCGNIFRNMEMKIKCQETGKSLGPNQPGELCLRGPQMSLGYYKYPEATADSFMKDGWVLTGDLAYYNENFETFIVDRIKELIKYKGLQVAPAELEGIILSHKDVMECCVIGIPDERAGELPRAFVVLKKDSTVTAEEIATFLAERVSPFKQLRGGVEFVEMLPKLASGKLLRRKVKEDFLVKLKS